MKFFIPLDNGVWVRDKNVLNNINIFRLISSGVLTLKNFPIYIYETTPYREKPLKSKALKAM